MTSERVFKLRGLGDEVLREYRVNGWGSAGGGNPGEGWVHVKDFLYGPEGIFATRSRSGDTTYFHKDHLGTPRALTDGLGHLIGRHDDYPFGTEIPRSDQADEPTKKYTGHERDPHNRADYMLGRTYLYPFMRFATPDRARDGWNLYAYTGNNPVNRVDPDGAFSIVVGTSFDPRSLDDPLNQPSTPSFKEVVSFLVSLVPGLGDVKDGQEALTGVDLITNEELSTQDRVLTGAAAAVPVVSGKMAREAGQAILRNGDEVSNLSREARKSIRSFERNIAEHREKLEAYKRNPDAFDNKGFLENAPSQEIREQIINGRIQHLEDEIRSFQDQINGLSSGGD